MGFLLPVLEFMQGQGAIDKEKIYWSIIYDFFAYFDLSVNLSSLLSVVFIIFLLYQTVVFLRNYILEFTYNQVLLELQENLLLNILRLNYVDINRFSTSDLVLLGSRQCQLAAAVFKSLFSFLSTFFLCFFTLFCC